MASEFHISLNDQDLTRLRLRLTLYGAWVAECVHSDPSVVPSVGDPASITLASSQMFVGTVARVAALQDQSYDTLVVGGGGGLSTSLPVLQLVGPTVGLVLDQAFRDGSSLESLSSTVDASLLSTQLQSWRRPVRTLGRELDAVCSSLSTGTSWRVLSDGTVWIGTVPPSTPVQAVVQDYDVMSWDASQGLVVIAAEDPTVLPGQSWPDVPGTIGTVIHDVTAERTRSELYLSSPGDREVGALDRLFPDTDLLASYQYRVLSPNGDGTLELRSTDTRLPDLSRVPVRFGIPGTTAVIPSGNVVMVGFGAGGSSDPYVASWVSGNATDLTVQVSPSGKIKLTGGIAMSPVLVDGVAVSFKVQASAALTEVAAFMTALGIPTVNVTTLISSLSGGAFESTVVEAQ